MRLITLALCALLLAACSEKDLRRTYEIINASAVEVPLTEPEVAAALRDALARGASLGAARASRDKGYFGDPRLRIEFPPDAERAAATLRKIGFGDQVDRFERQLNRAAERAAASAKPIFIKAITAMSIDDAFEILRGPNDAATRYLRRETGGELRTAFGPIVRDALDETRATRYYAEIAETYNELPLTPDIEVDLAGYATERAIDGLFVMIADEEARIRADPAARTTKLLRRVFGSLD